MIKTRDSYTEKHKVSARDRAAMMGKSKEGGSRGGGGSVVEGRFDTLRLHPKRSVWVRFNKVSWSYEVYDRETEQVVEISDAFWIEAINHYVGSNGKRFWCSATAHRNKPCYGCSARDLHWSWVNKKREEGVELSEQKREAPISASSRVGIPVTICDPCVGAYAIGEDGKPLGKEGRPYINWTPQQFVKFDKTPFDEGKVKPGMKAWWNIPATVFANVQDLVTRATFYCANCPAGSEATPLLFKRYKCENCDAKYSYDEPIRGNDIEDPDTLHGSFRCSSCKHKGPRIPIPSCPSCKHGKAGEIFDFDWKLIKKELGENVWTFEVKGMRVKTDDPELKVLEAAPLEVAKIMGPTPLTWQEGMVPEALRTRAGSRRHIKDQAPEAESYGDTADEKSDNSESLYD